MESDKIFWVIKTRDKDLEFTLHENKLTADKECASLNSQFGGRFYVDTYIPYKERHEGISK